MKFEKITADHIVSVGKLFEPGTIPGHERPNLYVVELNGKAYPVKPLLREAYKLAYHSSAPGFTSGEARNFLVKKGFPAREKTDIADKIQDIIRRYISWMRNSATPQQMDKWRLLRKYKGKPDLSAANFSEEIRSVDYGDLIYFDAKRVMYQLAEHWPEAYCNCLKILFDAGTLLPERIERFQKNLAELYQQLSFGREHGHDERTMATLLAFFSPDDYPLYKYSFYYKLCQLLGTKTGSKNECYPHYISLLKDIIEAYVVPNEELMELKKSMLTPDCYPDENHLILGQDILYRVLDKGTEEADLDFDADAIAGLLRKNFNEIWRCADSGHWPELRDSGLLTFDWLNKNIDYTKAKQKDIKRGWASINPWANSLSSGDLIIIMAKNSFQGICVARSEYDFEGPFLKIGEQYRPAIKVDYLFKLDKGMAHGMTTHNNPRAFSKIDQFNFGLKNTLSFLINRKPEAITALLSYLDNNTKQKNMTNELQRLHCNTILYGPPGTGKTYELSRLQNDLFTDETAPGSTQHASEILRKRMEDYTYWEVIAAVLYASQEPMSVKAICDSELYRARFNPTNKVKPQNMAWVDLQAYATDASTNSAAKYRRALQIFEKNENSEWQIPLNKRPEVAGILEEELLQLAANPVIDQTKHPLPNERFYFITFHQKYSYEDFIEGIKPVLAGVSLDEEGSNLQFKLEKGIFYKAALDALRLAGYESFKACKSATKAERKQRFAEVRGQADKQFALLIDEINRANISAVLGELITLIEDSKRIGEDQELWVKLPYSGDDFCVPPNLFIIGTMNTADKSIALLDIALRRRFQFRPMYPKYELATEGNSWWGPLLRKLNEAIYEAKNQNPDFFIGHAFFIDKPEASMNVIWNTTIIPLLMEYFQNNQLKVEKVLTAAGVAYQRGDIAQNYQIVV